MKKLLSLTLALALALCLLPGAALAAGTERVSGEGWELALDGTDITVTLTAGDWAKEHYMLRVTLYCSDDGSSSSYGGVDNYEDEVSPGQTVTAKLRAGADFALPAYVSASALNRDYDVHSIFTVNLYQDDAGTITLNPAQSGTQEGRLTGDVLAHNQAMMEGWVNFAAPAVSPAIQAQSDQICAGLRTDAEKLKAVHDWVCENVYYDFDEYYRIPTPQDTLETIFAPTSADVVLENRRGVCAGYANLTQHLLAAQGIPCIVTEGYALGLGSEGSWVLDSNADGINHAWNEAWVDGRWVTLDTTWDSQNTYGAGEYFDPRPLRRTYFDPDPAQFAVDHRIIERGGDMTAVPSDWAQDEIFEGMVAFLYPSAVMRGYATDITRKDFCALMISLLEASSGQDIQAYLKDRGLSAQDVFPDTDDENVLAAYALGIVKGKVGRPGRVPDQASATGAVSIKDAVKGAEQDTLYEKRGEPVAGDAATLWFDANGKITRQEAAVMLENCARLLGAETGGGKTFADQADVADWAASAVNYVSGLSDGGRAVMGDTGAGTFTPLGTFTREQAMVAALRLFHCAQR